MSFTRSKRSEVLEELNQADPEISSLLGGTMALAVGLRGHQNLHASIKPSTIFDLEILRANSHLQAANLARLKTETLVRLQDDKIRRSHLRYCRARDL